MTISLPGSFGRLRALIASHRSSVEALLRRAGVPDGDAPDGAQKVFLVAARRLDDVPPEKERAFLLGVARRVALDARRRARRRPDAGVELPLDVADAAPLPDERLDHARARALVDRALASMEEELREVFVLARIEEHSVSEIADRLAIPRGTAASRLRRANERFDETIARNGARDEHARAVARRASFLAFFPRWAVLRAALAVSTAAIVAAPPLAAPHPERSSETDLSVSLAAPHPGLSLAAPHPGLSLAAPHPGLSLAAPHPGPPPAERGEGGERAPALRVLDTPASAIPIVSKSPIAPPYDPLPPPASQEGRGGALRPEPDADALLAELRSLEAVRAAAARGDAAAARALLDAHRAAFPSGHLGPEASLVGADVAASRSGGRPAHAR